MEPAGAPPCAAARPAPVRRLWKAVGVVVLMRHQRRGASRVRPRKPVSGYAQIIRGPARAGALRVEAGNRPAAPTPARHTRKDSPMSNQDADLAARLAPKLKALHAANGGNWDATSRDALALIREDHRLEPVPGGRAGEAETAAPPREDD
jgi:hypothetical protein